MEENKLTHKPHVGPKPVQAEPNAVREKTYDAPNSPKPLREERQKTPIREAEDDVEGGMDEATDKVKKRL